MRLCIEGIEQSSDQRWFESGIEDEGRLNVDRKAIGGHKSKEVKSQVSGMAQGTIRIRYGGMRHVKKRRVNRGLLVGCKRE